MTSILVYSSLYKRPYIGLISHFFCFGRSKVHPEGTKPDYLVDGKSLTLRELLEMGPPAIIVDELIRLNENAKHTDQKYQKFAQDLHAEASKIPTDPTFTDTKKALFLRGLKMTAGFNFPKSREGPVPPHWRTTAWQQRRSNFVRSKPASKKAAKKASKPASKIVSKPPSKTASKPASKPASKSRTGQKRKREVTFAGVADTWMSSPRSPLQPPQKKASFTYNNDTDDPLLAVALALSKAELPQQQATAINDTSGWVHNSVVQPAERLDPSQLLATNVFSVPAIPLSDVYEDGPPGLDFLCMPGYENSVTVPTDEQGRFLPNKVTERTLRPRRTVGDGTCALHALLGQHLLDGCIVFSPGSIAETELRRTTRHHARRHALSRLQQDRTLFVSCASRMLSAELADKRDNFCVEEQAELTRLQMRRGSFVLQLVQEENLCTEDSDFFLEMRSVRSAHKQMSYTDFMQEVTAELCNEVYFASPVIRDAVQQFAPDQLSALDGAIALQRTAHDEKRDDFFFVGEGARAYNAKFLNPGHFLVDDEIEAVAVACDKAVILVQGGVWVCRVFNPNSTNLRVILQEGHSGSQTCHYSLLMQNQREPPMTSSPSPSQQSAVPRSLPENVGQGNAWNPPRSREELEALEIESLRRLSEYPENFN